MVLPIELLKAFGLERTPYPVEDMRNFFKQLDLPEEQTCKIHDALEEMDKPFYRYFSNYDTGIGEAIEEVVLRSFEEFIPKNVPKMGKHGKLLKGTSIHPVYVEYNKQCGKKSSNYDLLAKINGEMTSWEVKVIRSAVKPPDGDKIQRIPSLLEERALTFAEGTQSANGTFQQTKADMFDYLLGIVMYSDQVDYYIVPSEHIKNGGLKIGNQHAGAILLDGSTKEGHLSLKDLDKYKVKSVHTEEELLSKDSLLNYIS
jgi:hypothetical protein